MLDSIVLLNQYSAKIALIEQGVSYTYRQVLDNIDIKRRQLRETLSSPCSVVLIGDFSFSAISWLFALLTEKYVVLLQTQHVSSNPLLIAKAGIRATIYSENDTINVVEVITESPSINRLIDENKGGVLLMSSGTAGNPKLIVHAASRLLSKYQFSKKAHSTLGFLLFDHIAGFDTLMYTLHAGGSLVILPNRQVETVLSCLKKYDVEVLPTTPSYINLLLFQSDFNPAYLSNLKIITFGSERMNQSTLSRLIERFGNAIRFEQKYGLTELGSLVIKSKPNDPKWIKLDDRHATWKVVDNLLYIKTNTSLEAYIFPNHEVVCDGWFNTEDNVIVDGEWIQILGRNTDLINVGGQKVYPSEIESIIQQMDGVVQVVVVGISHPIMGQVVKATIQLDHEESESEFRSKLRLFCKDKLESFKIPVLISLSTSDILSERFKAQRKS